MKICLVVTGVILLCMGSGFSAGVEEAPDVIEAFDTGVINWTQGVFVSKGAGSPPERRRTAVRVIRTSH